MKINFKTKRIKVIIALLTITSYCSGQHKTGLTADKLDSIKDANQDAIDNELDKMKDSTHFELGMSVDSKSVYLGRAFGNKGMLYNRIISYFHKSGFGVDITEELAQKSKFAAGTANIDLSYQYSFTDWWDLQGNYIYWFIN